MQKLRYAFISFFLIFQLFGQAQVDYFNENHTPLTQEERFNSLLIHKTLNAMDNSVPGYRIQIYFESGNFSKSMALRTKEEFESIYRGYNAYISFHEPYYRVRVGDFRTKIEARGFLKKILRRYPAAYEIKDQISFNG
jgi:hypothetical protein